MTRKADERFCAEHLKEQNTHGRKRVPCPVSPGHTVWEDQVHHHVPKCKAAGEVPRDKWFKLDYNLSDKSEDKPKLSEITAEDYRKWAEKAAKLYDSIKEPITREVLDHPGLASRLSELQNQKHAIQQASLIGHMDKHGLLSDDAVVAEFGCGRGELSRYIARSQVLNQLSRHCAVVGGQKYLLVDRAGPRNKLDGKIAKDLEELETPATSQKQTPQVERSKIDIKDLNLGTAVSELFGGTCQPVSIVSKHLCGCATDLTLRCLANAGEAVALRGVAIALCCRQLCNFGMYPDAGRVWLQEHGITAEGFAVLAKMTSWAVCGTRRHNGSEETSAHHPSGYSEAERQAIGHKVRRVIDYGRLLAVRGSERVGTAAGYDARLIEYVDPSVSLENICLLVHKRTEDP
ncbi:tRNA:m(4)X modification enzyme Trm13p [Trichomonascus vanleenenianus]|uniref:tRNA:m4X modification enzyme n=1 Tax=Trichomonascus vanleenenianus TaxID=2268995 RepID=UPI003ECAEE72